MLVQFSSNHGQGSCPLGTSSLGGRVWLQVLATALHQAEAAGLPVLDGLARTAAGLSGLDLEGACRPGASSSPHPTALLGAGWVLDSTE